MFEIFAQSHHVGVENQDDISDIPMRFADLLFNQASLLEIVLILGIISLGYYIHYESKGAKIERKDNTEKFEQLIIRSQDATVQMASDVSRIDTRLDNIERELESQKDFIFANLRKV